jgi:mycothiol synthase
MGYHCDFVELRMRYDLSKPLPSTALATAFETWNATTAPQFFATYREAFRERMGDHEPDAAEWISDHTDDTDFRADWSLLARVKGEAAGFVTMFVLDEDAKSAYLSQIGTLPAYRGQGVSVALMAEIARRLVADGFTELILHVNANNPHAIAIYKKFGFNSFGRRGKFSR